MEHHDTTKHIIDAISLGGVVATLAGWLPSIAAILSIIWTLFRLVEMVTGKPMHIHIQEWKNK